MSLQDGLLIRGLRKLAANIGLDQRDFVIFGSGPLLAHKLCAHIGDLDVVVRQSAWDSVVGYAKLNGKLVVGTENGALIAQFRIGDSCIEFSSGWVSEKWKADELIAGADEVDGLLFANLRKVLEYKEALARPKDSAHIAILNAHFAKG